MAQLWTYSGAMENTLKLQTTLMGNLILMNTLPHFDVPEGETSKTYLRKVCEREIPPLIETSEGITKHFRLHVKLRCYFLTMG